MIDQVTLEPQTLGTYRRDGEQFVTVCRAAGPYIRWYATDPVSLRSGIALTRALRQKLEIATITDTAPFIALLGRIALHVPSFRQSWRPAPEQPTPQPWRDEITNTALPNPFLPPVDPRGQTVLRQRAPALADHLQRLADSPYELLAELADRKARRTFLASITYGAQAHKHNVFRFDDIDARNQFAAAYRELLDVYVAESRPVRFPWAAAGGNLSELGQLLLDLRANPIEGVPAADEIFPLAKQIDAQLLDAERREAVKATEEAQRRSRELSAPVR